MRIDGLHLAFLDIPAEYTQEYNRWYDLDHMPEHVSKPDVVMGRRYVATKSTRTLPMVQPGERFGGHPPYLTIYFFGGPLDMMSEEARQGWRTMDHGIVKQGRYWMQGHGTGGVMVRVGRSFARPDCHVGEEAIAHLNHRSVIIAYGKPPSPEQRDDAIAWWDAVHLPDLFAVPGVLGALRADPIGQDDDDIVHVLLCTDPAEDVMPRIESALRYQGAQGRWPPYGGVYEPLAFVPYDRIVPLEYDFDIGD